jgi:anti-anti-sigma factor
VDFASVGVLRQHLQEALRRGLPVLLDCAHLGYIDSTGFDVLFEFSRACAQEGVSVVLVLGPKLVRLAEIAGLRQILPVAEFLEGALALLEGTRKTGPAG